MAIKQKKMAGEDRRAEIAMSARRKFAQKGFHGTSMRDIARSAKVSEALIYRHFPSKEALYEEAYFYIDPQVDSLCKYFEKQEPSTLTLVKMVYSLTHMILSEMPGRGEEQRVFERLLAYSLLENPAFAESVFRKYDKELTPIWLKCIKAAAENGDMYETLVDPVEKMWFTHHLVMAINFLQLSGGALFSSKGWTQDLIAGIVVFILRGVGLTDAVVQKYTQPRAMDEITSEILDPEHGWISQG